MTDRIQISLAAARVNAGMTIEDVAREMKSSKQTIINLEKGRRSPRPAEMAFLSNLYKISVDNIFLPR